MNKRILSILLCLMLVASLLVMAVPVSAADALQIVVTADTTEANPGDTVTYTITLKNVKNLASFDMKLAIPDGMTYVDKSGKITPGLQDEMGYDTLAFTNSSLVINGVGLYDYSSDSDVTLCTFECTVNEDASGTITMGFVERKFSFANDKDEVLAYEVSVQDVTVASAATEPVTEPETEPETEPATEPETEAETEAETQAETEAETQAPQLTYVPEVPATYDTPGVKEHYVDGSGNKFADATGLVPVTDEDLYIAPLGPTEPATEPATEAETTAPATEPATEAETTAPVTEPATEAETEAVTEAVTEPVTEASTEDATIVVPTVDPADPTDAPAPATEAGTEAVTPVTDPTSSDATEAGGAATGDSASKDSATSDSSATSTSSTPTTGDSTHMYLWMIIMLASLAGACAVLYTAKRKGIFNK